MNKYNIRMYYHSFIDIEVQANSEELAKEKARVELEDMSDKDFFDTISCNMVSDEDEDECKIID